ncbi:hypothetical protein FOA52_010752 [Chlamydomonas sp. UWO 241]|nr:hypothetical protein FOA52_010752 [Chlamydomonas sp. UWO 241]
MGNGMGQGMMGPGPMGMPFPGGMPPPGMMMPMGMMGGQMGMMPRPQMGMMGGQGMGGPQMMGFPPGMGMPGMGSGMPGMGMGGMHGFPPRPGPGPLGPGGPGGGIIAGLRASAGIVRPVAPAEKATTVYVGKIASTVPDGLISSLLSACGEVASWKRAEDPETREPKGFGFCEFENAEGVLRAIRLMHGLKVDGQELLVKGNTATQKYVEEYESNKAKQMAEDKEAALTKAKKAQEEGEVLDEAALAAEVSDAGADNSILERIMGLVSDREEVYQRAHGGGPLPPPPPLPPPAAASGGRGHSDAPGGGDRDRERERTRDRERERDTSRDRGGGSRGETREHRGGGEERGGASGSGRSGAGGSSARVLDPVEEEAKRVAERAYETRLREWERTEREMGKARDREAEREAAAGSERRRVLRDDAERPDPDDVACAPWERRPVSERRGAEARRKRRAAEAAEDDADRALHGEDIAANGGDADAGEEGPPPPQPSDGDDGDDDAGEPQQQAQQQQQQQQPQQPAPQSAPAVDPSDPIYRAMVEAARGAPSAAAHSAAHQAQHFSSGSANAGGGGSSSYAAASTTAGHKRELAREPSPAAARELPPPPSGAGGGIRKPPAKVARVAALFGDDDDDGRSRRTLKPIQYTEEELRSVHEAEPGAAAQGAPVVQQARPAVAQPAEDRQAQLRRLMDTIPTSRDGVWSFAIRWEHFDKDSMGSKFSNWIGQKVEQLLGMPEPSLVGYVTDLLSQSAPPSKTYDELHPVLDADTETFVIKLYRMVIYETEKAAARL